MIKLILAAALLVSGCATIVDPAGQAVQITSTQDRVKGCKFIGQTSVDAHSMPVGITRNNAIASMRNKAAGMGGNVVVSEGPQVTMPGPVATMNGDVYAC